VLCEKLDALNEDNWEHGVPIPNFAQEVALLTATTLGPQLPCIFGWIAALLCELRVQQDVMADRYGPDTELFLHQPSSIFNEEDSHMEEKQQVLDALRNRDETTMAQLQSRGRWILRDLLHGGHRALTLLESSGWAKLTDVLEVLPPGEVGPAFDAAAWAMGHRFLQQVTNIMVHPPNDLNLRPFKVWGVSSHPSLLLEPLSLWSQLFETEATLSTTRCLDDFLAPGVQCQTLHVFHLGTRQDGLGHFPLVENFQDFGEQFFQSASRFAQESDLLLCGEPAFLCWLLFEWQKPVIGYLGNPLGAYLNTEMQIVFYDFVAKTLATHTSLQLVFMSPPIAAQSYWQTGTLIPVLRPVADYMDVQYNPENLDVLITKQVFTFWDFQCILNAGISEGEISTWRFQYMSHLDSTWKAWSTFRAAVVLPYDAQTLVFYELYSLGLPLLVPQETLLPLFFMRSYGQDGHVAHQRPGWNLRRSGAAWGRWHQGSFNELRWWAMFSDIARLPHLLVWSSLAELFSLLCPALLATTSTAMLEVTKQNRQRSLEFWRASLAHHILPRDAT